MTLGKEEWTTCSCTKEVVFAWAICPWFIQVSLHPGSHYWGSLASLG